MKVRVLYFAALRDLAERSEEVIELPAGVATIDTLRPFLESHVPALAGRLGTVRIARNEAFAEPGETLEEGDVIALIPPVAGGA